MISQLKVGVEALAERLNTSDLSLDELEAVIGKVLPFLRMAVDTSEIKKWTNEFVAAKTQKEKGKRLSVLSTKCDQRTIVQEVQEIETDKKSEEFNYLTEDEDLKEAVSNANRLLAGIHHQVT
jgi:hypothetical protein